MPDNNPSNDPSLVTAENHLTPSASSANDEIALFGNRVGGWVLGLCALLGVSLVILLFIQTYSLNIDPLLVSAPDCETQGTKNCSSTVELITLWTNNGLSAEEAARVSLEYDAQFLRTKRAQSLVSARLFVWSIAILAGISQLTMGSAFIFARIRNENPSVFSLESENGRKAYLSSIYPGVVLAAFGMLIIMSALFASTQTKHNTQDMPVYLDWPIGMRAHMLAEQRAKLAANTNQNSGGASLDLQALADEELRAAAERNQ